MCCFRIQRHQHIKSIRGLLLPPPHIQDVLAPIHTVILHEGVKSIDVFVYPQHLTPAGWQLIEVMELVLQPLAALRRNGNNPPKALHLPQVQPPIERAAGPLTIAVRDQVVHAALCVIPTHKHSPDLSTGCGAARLWSSRRRRRTLTNLGWSLQHSGRRNKPGRTSQTGWRLGLWSRPQRDNTSDVAVTQNDLLPFLVCAGLGV
mmetsp:Transcript_13987/g.30961  ORF Transcript_13987/g.30961 Transcript_13987/m.30961 type:complete len:204 (-) Transcript_13987:803-1414(-)